MGVQDPKSPYGYGISGLSAVALYVPRENRHPERYAPFESFSIPSNMLDDDIGYETLVEDFNAYSATA